MFSVDIDVNSLITWMRACIRNRALVGRRINARISILGYYVRWLGIQGVLGRQGLECVVFASRVPGQGRQIVSVKKSSEPNTNTFRK